MVKNVTPDRRVLVHETTLVIGPCGLAVCAAFSLQLLGCEALLNVGGLTEQALDDGGFEDAVSAGDGVGLVPAEAGGHADATAGDGAGPQTVVTSRTDAEAAEPDGAVDATLLAPGDGLDSGTPAPDDTSTTQNDGPAPVPDSGLGTLDAAAGGSPADGPTADSGPPETSYGSCLEILNASPTSSSATYTIAPAGSSLVVRCDMDFAGGGWTLVQSTNGGTCTPATETAGTVALGSCSYMPRAALTALAQRSTLVHIRTASGPAAPVSYVTSATSVPIQNLQMGLIANANEPVGDPVAEAAAWTVVGDPGHATSQGRTPESILAFTCSVAGEMWPAVYHACGNGADGVALDVVDNDSFWNWGIMPHVNVAMEVYVR